MDDQSNDGRFNRRSVVMGAAALTAGVLTGSFSFKAQAAAASGPVAMTAYGRIRGYNDGPIKVFKGVPYGASTAGANRWLPPKPPVKWTGIKDTVEAGAMAPQGRGAPLAEEQAMSQTAPQSEDCLNLNISTPAVGAKSGKRPVIVWFHGGGFTAGSGNATSYDGRNLAEKNNVVLVTVTHRLNALGFLYLADLFGSDYADAGNVGILDCAAALRWVRDNIAQFGGDPANVTIAGQSGGGAKVAALMTMPSAKGLFQKAIGQSGALMHLGIKEEASAAAKRLVDTLGVKTIAELQALPAEQLVLAAEKMHLMTNPVVDGRTFSAQPFSPEALPLSRDIPLLLGTNETESTFFPNTPLDPIDDVKMHDMTKNALRLAGMAANDADTDKLIEIFRRANPGKDNTYVFQILTSQTSLTQESVIAEAERKVSQPGAPVYVYYFVKHSPVRDGKLRAVHTLEIPFVFDSLAHSAPIIGTVTSDQQALADKMSATWASFARTGNPNNPKIPQWPGFDTQVRNIMVIGDEWTVAADPLHDTRLAIADLKMRSPALPPMPLPGPPPPKG